MFQVLDGLDDGLAGTGRLGAARGLGQDVQARSDVDRQATGGRQAGEWQAFNTRVDPFDPGTAVPLRRERVGHWIETAFEHGWSALRALQNGGLTGAAPTEGSQVGVTTDKNLKHPPALAARTVSIVVLMSTGGPRIQSSWPAVADAIHGVTSAGYLAFRIE